MLKSQEIRRGRITLSANIILTASLIARTFSLGFVAISIYIKIAESVLDENVIKIVNIYDIYGMPIGTTTKWVVFSLIGAFVLDTTSGVFGVCGAFYKKPYFLVVNIVLSSVMIVIYAGYITLISIVYYKKSALSEVLYSYGETYTHILLQSNYQYDYFPSFMRKLGCTINHRTSCYEQYNEQLSTFLEAYLGIISSCLMCQIIVVVASEYTYRKFEVKASKEKISRKPYYLLLTTQHGLCRSLCIFARRSFQKSVATSVAVVIKICLLLSGVVMLILGIYIVQNDFITNSKLKNIFYKLQFYNYYFYDIKIGLTATCIVIGTCSILIGVTGIVSSWKKSRKWLCANVVMSAVLQVVRVLTFVLGLVIFLKILSSLEYELSIQQAGYYYSLSVNEITEAWNTMLLTLECCGVRSYADTYGNSYGTPFCCKNANEHILHPGGLYSSIDYNNFAYIGGCTGFKTTTCSFVIEYRIKVFMIIFLTTVMTQIVLECLGFAYVNKEFQKFLPSVKASENRVTDNNIFKVIFCSSGSAIKNNWKRSKSSRVVFISVLVCFVSSLLMLILIVCLRYDAVFGNKDINDHLFEDVYFENVSLKDILYYFIIITTTYSVALGCMSSFGLAVILTANKRRFKLLISFEVSLILLALCSIVILVVSGLWTSWIMSSASEKLSNDMAYYYKSDTSWDHGKSLAWNTLYVKNKCCGVGAAGWSSFQSTTWWTSPNQNGKSIPDYCCKSETRVYPYESKSTNACTTLLTNTLHHSDGCDTALKTRLSAYMIVFFVAISIVIIMQLLGIISTILELVREYRLIDALHETIGNQLFETVHRETRHSKQRKNLSDLEMRKNRLDFAMRRMTNQSDRLNLVTEDDDVLDVESVADDEM
ncbi:uncharacterized protein LOC127706053 isoform X1 [Mytilus californianus]|uniref:uncharacterized protein LOC127706053 isoform X1 n=3 Tax=Mytilus californianus TaxID=6549 RepID=UPI0022477410|nr:uncharacterized protein LOC127706053 isoform X1 [Mytilus californianus]